jgi:hypothetical protein
MEPSKVPGKKAGPNGSFPIGDNKHAKLAIGGATHSFDAGNIGKGTEDKIKAEARAKLGESRGGKAKPKTWKKKKSKSAEPDFAAGRSTSRTRSWGAFAGGQGAPQQQAPGLGGAPQPQPGGGPEEEEMPGAAE